MACLFWSPSPSWGIPCSLEGPFPPQLVLLQMLPIMRTSFALLAGASLKSPLLAGPQAFDAVFTHSELRRALSHCVHSAAGLDGLPHSLFKVNSFRGAPSRPCGNAVSSSLSSKPRTLPRRRTTGPFLWLRAVPRCSKHMVLSRIGPHICPQLDESQGGCRWSADCLLGSPSLPSLTFRRHSTRHGWKGSSF